jgi:hypothetical protein
MIAAAFLCRLAAGCVMMLAACRTDHVSWTYFRLIGFVTFGLLIAAGGFVAVGESPLSDGPIRSALPWLVAGVIGVVAHLTLNTLQGDRPRGAQRVIPLLAGAALIVATVMLSGSTAPPLLPAGDAADPGMTSASSGAWFAASPEAADWRSPNLWIHVLMSAALLGGTTTAMLLGHAYLTFTAMPIDPLRRLTRLLAGAFGARLIVIGVALWPLILAMGDPPGRRDVMWMWLMLSVRLGAGVLALGALIYMVWDCVKRRSTQSATGILYITMIMAFLGELAATELARVFGLWV